ncbi:murein DD-endopeptidase MepM/ murein hydrolase activator NlpD [Brevibacterium sanguinis]|uniref:Murein DD-endopeptidase MepM/ murein hydrolase activator NlpD n=3 Tax=Brevibacteriaceae TaxID=85019 RepID=A0A366INM1_9MICO|nr:murein DD-endopeptidase MepM/ murein hydrolase activator NlpD [Brevibacterium sanguinis]RBP74673.1 murein DD-endopeptidase MepM/ murein hydrolase activator NlpD [Brevibacterium celere]
MDFDGSMQPIDSPVRAHRHRFRAAAFAALLLLFATIVAGAVLPVPGDRAVAAPRDEPAWVSLVPAMEIVEAFDPPAETWLAGHRGIDVLAVVGEPLRAPTAGTLRFRGAVAGAATVSIETESGFVVSFQPATSTLDKGERFAAGETIGEVAAGAHCSDSCLHIGVWPTDSDRRYVDPARFFGQESSLLLPLARKPSDEPAEGSSSSGAGAWGGHRNGRIPASAMCPLKTAPGHMLRCDAQEAFDRLSHAYETRFGTPISVTDSYRDYDTQVILKRRKGRMAATPGRSNHGWALAVDLGGGINSFGTAEHRWMRENGPTFGWIHPGWARQNGSLPEAWHWEFRK